MNSLEKLVNAIGRVDFILNGVQSIYLSTEEYVIFEEMLDNALDELKRAIDNYKEAP